MAPIVFIVGISNCLGSQYYNPAGLRARSARYIVAGALVNLCLNLLLIPQLKSNGAVIATVIAELTISFLYIRNSDGYYSLMELLRVSWKKVMAGALMLLIILTEGRYIPNGFLSLLIQICSGVIVYSMILLIMRDSFMTEVVLPQARAFFMKIFPHK